MPKLFAPLALLALAAPALRADDGIPLDTLKDIKAATVFVKVATNKGDGSGSGFLIRLDGDTGYVVTNHHVITPPPKVNATVRSIQVVFNSGKTEEKVVNAEVVARDSYRDLAVLKVDGVKDVAKPIDLGQKVELVETMNVYLFGFPFGEALSTTKGNPAMTVGKGTVSSVRENDLHDVAVVQIDGNINPGNSGGPVVDSKGRLVGVAVAKITNTNIGFAIPPVELTRMLNGRLGSTYKVNSVRSENGVAEVEVEAELIDPFNKLREPVLYFAFTDKVKPALQKDKDGRWPLLPNAEKVELKIDKQKAVGRFKVEAEAAGTVAVTFQTTAVNSEGVTLVTPPGQHNIEVRR